MTLRLATRQSPLALWQANHVRELILDSVPGREIELVSTDTAGDRDQTSPISALGGKGVFSSEVQHMVAAGLADFAVHSAKDLQSVSPDGLVLAAFPERGDARDALVGGRLADLPTGATVATGSARRRVQLLAQRPDLQIVELRGNIGTRLGKASQYDAIVMAHVALLRLEEAPAVVDVLSPQVMIPQVGQGALAVECRVDAPDTLAILQTIDHGDTRRVVEAERRFLETLGGDCELPAGAHAVLTGAGELTISGLLADGDGTIVTGQVTGSSSSVGSALALDLLSRVGTS